MELERVRGSNVAYAGIKNENIITEEIRNAMENMDSSTKAINLRNDDEKPNDKKIYPIIAELNEILTVFSHKMIFQIFEDKKNMGKDEIYVALIDKQTGKVIREIPPKKILEMRSKIREYVGMLIDEKI